MVLRDLTCSVIRDQHHTECGMPTVDENLVVLNITAVTIITFHCSKIRFIGVACSCANEVEFI